LDTIKRLEFGKELMPAKNPVKFGRASSAFSKQTKRLRVEVCSARLPDIDLRPVIEKAAKTCIDS
jgi:hypothetical protein